MFKINENYLKLPGSYLFSTVGRKEREYKSAHPDKKVIKLSIGDVTQSIAPTAILLSSPSISWILLESHFAPSDTNISSMAISTPLVL